MSQIQERYRPELMTANQTLTGVWNGLAGFICKTSGNISVTNSNGTLVLDAIGVTAGVYLPLPFRVGGGRQGGNNQPSSIVLAGGASGTILVY